MFLPFSFIIFYHVCYIYYMCAVYTYAYICMYIYMIMFVHTCILVYTEVCVHGCREQRSVSSVSLDHFHFVLVFPYYLCVCAYLHA